MEEMAAMRMKSWPLTSNDAFGTSMRQRVQTSEHGTDLVGGFLVSSQTSHA